MGKDQMPLLHPALRISCGSKKKDYNPLLAEYTCCLLGSFRPKTVALGPNSLWTALILGPVTAV